MTSSSTTVPRVAIAVAMSLMATLVATVSVGSRIEAAAGCVAKVEIETPGEKSAEFGSVEIAPGETFTADITHWTSLPTGRTWLTSYNSEVRLSIMRWDGFPGDTVRHEGLAADGPWQADGFSPDGVFTYTNPANSTITEFVLEVGAWNRPSAGVIGRTKVDAFSTCVSAHSPPERPRTSCTTMPSMRADFQDVARSEPFDMPANGRLDLDIMDSRDFGWSDQGYILQRHGDWNYRVRLYDATTGAQITSRTYSSEGFYWTREAYVDLNGATVFNSNKARKVFLELRTWFTRGGGQPRTTPIAARLNGSSICLMSTDSRVRWDGGPQCMADDSTGYSARVKNKTGAAATYVLELREAGTNSFVRNGPSIEVRPDAWGRVHVGEMEPGRWKVTVIENGQPLYPPRWLTIRKLLECPKTPRNPTNLTVRYESGNTAGQSPTLEAEWLGIAKSFDVRWYHGQQIAQIVTADHEGFIAEQSTPNNNASLPAPTTGSTLVCAAVRASSGENLTTAWTRPGCARIVRCAGLNATVIVELGELPTDGDDVIYGTNGDDTIDAGAGNDVICARGGDDTIDAGAGSDKVYAGSGADVVEGGTGNDTVYGSTGDDTIDGGGGNDRLFGGSGDDSLDGGGGSDVGNGNGDNDTCRNIEEPSSCEVDMTPTSDCMAIDQPDLSGQPHIIVADFDISATYNASRTALDIAIGSCSEPKDLRLVIGEPRLEPFDVPVQTPPDVSLDPSWTIDGDTIDPAAPGNQARRIYPLTRRQNVLTLTDDDLSQPNFPRLGSESHVCIVVEAANGRGGWWPVQNVAPKCLTIEFAPTKQTIVSLGDSYAAGPTENTRDYILGENNTNSFLGDPDAPTVLGSQQACYRSYNSWPYLAAADFPSFDARHYACTGAVSNDLFASLDDPSDPESSPGNGPGAQPENTDFPDDYLCCGPTDALPEYQADGKLDATTRVVMLSIGGNDMAFSSVVKACYTRIGTCPPLAELLERGETFTEGRLRTTLTTIQNAAPNADVVLVGYPHLTASLKDVARACPWSNRSDMRQSQNAFNGDVLTAIDELNAARPSGPQIHFVDLRRVYSGHENCTLDPWLYPVEPDPNGGGPNNIAAIRSVHPTPKGHEETALAVSDCVALVLADPGAGDLCRDLVGIAGLEYLTPAVLEAYESGVLSDEQVRAFIPPQALLDDPELSVLVSHDGDFADDEVLKVLRSMGGEYGTVVDPSDMAAARELVELMPPWLAAGVLSSDSYDLGVDPANMTPSLFTGGNISPVEFDGSVEIEGISIGRDFVATQQVNLTLEATTEVSYDIRGTLLPDAMNDVIEIMEFGAGQAPTSRLGQAWNGLDSVFAKTKFVDLARRGIDFDASVNVEAGNRFQAEFVVSATEGQEISTLGDLTNVPSPFAPLEMDLGNSVLMSMSELRKVSTTASFKILAAEWSQAELEGFAVGVTRLDGDSVAIYAGPRDQVENESKGGFREFFVGVGLINRNATDIQDLVYAEVDLGTKAGVAAYEQFLFGMQVPTWSESGVRSGHKFVVNQENSNGVGLDVGPFDFEWTLNDESSVYMHTTFDDGEEFWSRTWDLFRVTEEEHRGTFDPLDGEYWVLGTDVEGLEAAKIAGLFMDTEAEALALAQSLNGTTAHWQLKFTGAELLELVELARAIDSPPNGALSQLVDAETPYEAYRAFQTSSNPLYYDMFVWLGDRDRNARSLPGEVSWKVVG